jgi:hypothetical protein
VPLSRRAWRTLDVPLCPKLRRPVEKLLVERNKASRIMINLYWVARFTGLSVPTLGNRQKKRIQAPHEILEVI